MNATLKIKRNFTPKKPRLIPRHIDCTNGNSMLVPGCRKKGSRVCGAHAIRSNLMRKKIINWNKVIRFSCEFYVGHVFLPFFITATKETNSTSMIINVFFQKVPLVWHVQSIVCLLRICKDKTMTVWYFNNNEKWKYHVDIREHDSIFYEHHLTN